MANDDDQPMSEFTDLNGHSIPITGPSTDEQRRSALAMCCRIMEKAMAADKTIDPKLHIAVMCVHGEQFIHGFLSDKTEFICRTTPFGLLFEVGPEGKMLAPVNTPVPPPTLH